MVYGTIVKVHRHGQGAIKGMAAEIPALTDALWRTQGCAFSGWSHFMLSWTGSIKGISAVSGRRPQSRTMQR